MLPEPMEAPFFTTVTSTFQSASVWRLSVGIGRPGVGVVNERHTMPDKNVVFNYYTLTDEGVAGDLAPLANRGVFLNFHKRTDLCLVTNFAAIKIDELRKLNALPQLDIRCNAEVIRSYRNGLPSHLQRFLGRFEQLDNAQSRNSVIKRRVVVFNAFNEVFQLDLQRFRLLDLRRPHVSRTIANQQVIHILGAGDLYALVVDLDLLVGFQVIPEQASSSLPRSAWFGP